MHHQSLGSNRQSRIPKKPEPPALIRRQRSRGPHRRVTPRPTTATFNRRDHLNGMLRHRPTPSVTTRTDSLDPISARRPSPEGYAPSAAARSAPNRRPATAWRAAGVPAESKGGRSSSKARINPPPRTTEPHSRWPGCAQRMIAPHPRLKIDIAEKPPRLIVCPALSIHSPANRGNHERRLSGRVFQQPARCGSDAESIPQV